jgi:alanine racemase
MNPTLSWLEISRSALKHNLQAFRELIGSERILCPAIKGNAYGHGLKECAPVLVEAGANWLCVNALFEAMELRASGCEVPIYIMGYVPLNELHIVVENGFRVVTYNKETVEKLRDVCRELKMPVYTHLKLETGNNRQGVLEADLDGILEIYRSEPMVILEGTATHFANIEDTTDPSYARFQKENFDRMNKKIIQAGFTPKYVHCANTASTLLYPEMYENMVRVGIGTYGLWPSNETFVSSHHLGAKVELKPVLTWKTRVAQLKKVPANAAIGYGGTYRPRYDSVIAVLPVGYYDGYDRKLSNIGHVLIGGKRAPVRGRVCMNILMVDVTGMPEVCLEDEVVLLGRQGDENVSAEQIARWVDTINYEVTTRINERLPRVVVS